MHIRLKIIGREVFSSLSKNIAALPSMFQAEPITWHAAYVTDELQPEIFLYSGGHPNVVVIEAHDVTALTHIEVVENRIAAFIKSHAEARLVRAPVMVVFSSKNSLQNGQDMPSFVSDWTYVPLDTQEFSQRVLSSLQRQSLSRPTLQYGAVTLAPETDDITFAGEALHLPPSEFMLAELFFSQMGVVVPFTDVISVFERHGKSTTTSNIRVAIYQLRLKLAILTKSEITLANVYKKGYCLRVRSGNASYRNN